MYCLCQQYDVWVELM